MVRFLGVAWTDLSLRYTTEVSIYPLRIVKLGPHLGYVLYANV